MLTFLRSTLVRVPLTTDARTAPVKLSPMARRRPARALVASLLLPIFIPGTAAPAARRHASLQPASPAAPRAQPRVRRIVTLRRGETPDGARLTLTSDTPLDDYKSYAEGERLFVHVPRAALAPAHTDLAHGRGFADLRVEERDDGVLLSFRLQTGATVAVHQNFNRLVVVFIANEESDRARIL